VATKRADSPLYASTRSSRADNHHRAVAASHRQVELDAEPLNSQERGAVVDGDRHQSP